MTKWIAKILLLGMAMVYSTLFASTPPLTGSSVKRFDRLQHDIISYMRRHDIPGASVAIMHNGKLLYARGIGWANVKTKTPVQPNSLFRIASISKTITAAAVMQLIQEHKINYDSKIFSVLNDLHPLPHMRENPLIKRITILNVLRMLSGWDGDELIGFDPVFGPWPPAYARKLSEKAPVRCHTAAEFMMGMPLQSVPGTHFSYANINYCLLGLVVNKVTHQPYGYQGYEQYVQMSVLRPMGITDMQIGSTEAPLPHEVHYYADVTNEQFPYGHEGIMHKAYSVGGWVATATDLVKFQHGLVQMLNYRSLTYIEEMPPGIHYRLVGGYYPTHYGMGWFISRYMHSTAWVTHGSFTGTRSILVKRPDGYVIAIIFNKKPSPQFKALREMVYTLLKTPLY